MEWIELTRLQKFGLQITRSTTSIRPEDVAWVEEIGPDMEPNRDMGAHAFVVVRGAGMHVAESYQHIMEQIKSGF